jgi:hypothetical protein
VEGFVLGWAQLNREECFASLVDETDSVFEILHLKELRTLGSGQSKSHVHYNMPLLGKILSLSYGDTGSPLKNGCEIESRRRTRI